MKENFNKNNMSIKKTDQTTTKIDSTTNNPLTPYKQSNSKLINNNKISVTNSQDQLQNTLILKANKE